MEEREFEALVRPLLRPPYPLRVAVGVSGGADSVCLTWLLRRWALRAGIQLHAVTVDHRLRPESASEAQGVGALLADWGVDHTILPLENPPFPFSQENARRARYEALALFCHRHDITTLFVAHHQGDQLETWAMRLGAGSKLLGLAGMRRVTGFLGLRIVRPLLSVPPDFLREVLGVQGIGWVEDRSNQETRFQRVRIRQQLEHLPVDEKYFWLNTIAKLDCGRRHLEADRTSFLKQHGHAGSEGYVTLKVAPLVGLPFPLQEVIFRGLLEGVGGIKRHPLSHQALRHVLYKLSRPGWRGVTIGGCYIQEQGDTLMIVREWQRIAPLYVTEGTAHVLWDGRFYLRLKEGKIPGPFWVVPQGRLHRSPKTPYHLTRGALPACKSQGFEKTPSSPTESPFEVIRWLGAPSFEN